MFRLIASILIALVAISSSLAHANAGAAPSGMDVSSHAEATHHSAAEMMKGHGDTVPTTHEDHMGACVLGHCAMACGVILTFHPTVASANLSSAALEYAEQTFAGLISTADPPPPKS